MKIKPLGDQFMDITIPRIVKAVDVGVESTTKEVNAQVDTIVGNGPKYNDGKYTNKYSPRHGKRRKDGGYQTGFVDLQMARQTIKQRSVTKESVGVRKIQFIPQEIREGLMSDQLFYFHNWGEGNNPRRQIFPDTVGGKAGGTPGPVGANGITPTNRLDPQDRIYKKFTNKAMREMKKVLMS